MENSGSVNMEIQWETSVIKHVSRQKIHVLHKTHLLTKRRFSDQKTETQHVRRLQGISSMRQSRNSRAKAHRQSYIGRGGCNGRVSTESPWSAQRCSRRPREPHGRDDEHGATVWHLSVCHQHRGKPTAGGRKGEEIKKRGNLFKMSENNLRCY